MEFSRKEERVIEAAAVIEGQEIVQLTDLQLFAVGGGVADVTLS